MKRLAIITLTAIMMASCGGDSATKSGLKKNEYLGNIPALYADYELARQAHIEVSNELRNRIRETNSSEARKQLDKESDKFDRIAEKILTKVESELAKIDGNPIVFALSETMEKLNIKVEYLIFRADDFTLKMQVSFVALHDFEINTYNWRNYDQIHYNIMSEKGWIIRTGRFDLVYLQHGQTRTIAKGQTFGNEVILNVDQRSECWAEFAGIVFYTSEDRDFNVPDENTCMGPAYMWQY